MALDYKKTLMVLSKRLRDEYDFDPSISIPSEQGEDPYGRIGRVRNLSALVAFFAFFDHHPEARQLLSELGGEWPMPDSETAMEPVELRLCEAAKLVLKPDQLYRFTVDSDCHQCKEAALDAIAGYGKGPCVITPGMSDEVADDCTMHEHESDPNKHQEEDKCPAWFEDECCCDQVPDRAHLYYHRWKETLKVLRYYSPERADALEMKWRHWPTFGTVDLDTLLGREKSIPDEIKYRQGKWMARFGSLWKSIQWTLDDDLPDPEGAN
jgi:hypothetical protein